MHYVLLASYLAVILVVSRLRETLRLLAAMLGSTVDTCLHQYLALFDEFCTCSTVK